MVWETLGALNSEGEEVLRQIFRFAAKQLGHEFSSYCGRAWARFSCCLQRSVGQAILIRIDGREFRDPLIPSEADTFLTQDAPPTPVHVAPALALAPPPSPSLSLPLPSLPAPPSPLPASSPPFSLPPPASTSHTSRPGIFAIKSDGHCCYHLGGVIGTLCKDPDALSHSPATCSDEDLAMARVRIQANLQKAVEPKREFFPEEQEMEAHIATMIGEALHEFTARVSGKVSGQARLGPTTDLALYTLEEDVRVMVIATDKIFSTTPDEKLLESVVSAFVPGEREKSRVVCAILHKEHFDLGVIRTLDSVKAVFQVGPEWDRALLSLLAFVF
jgi:hypothetical protein